MQTYKLGGHSLLLDRFNKYISYSQAHLIFDELSGSSLSGTQTTALALSTLFTSSIFDQLTFYNGGSAGTPNSITVTDSQPGFMAYAPTDGQQQDIIAPIRELADVPLLARMPHPAPAQAWHAWATAFGGGQTLDGNIVSGSATQTSTMYGGSLGVDRRFNDNFLTGVSVGGSNGDFSVPGRTTTGSVTGAHFAVYNLFTQGAFYGASSTSISFYSNTTNRIVTGFGGLPSESEHGNFASHEVRHRAEFGRHFATPYALVTPFVALEIAELRSYGFRETAIGGPGNFALNVGGQNTASVPSFLGLRLQRSFALGNGMTFSPALQAAWVHEFSPARNVVAGLVSLPGASFVSVGARPAADAAQVKLGGQLALNEHSSLFANFDGTFSGTDRLYAGKGGFKYVW